MAALDFPASPTVGQQYAAPNGITYQWDGAAWVVTGGPPAAPTGPAGGDLAGSTYPNPVIAANAVTGAKLAAGATLAGKSDAVGPAAQVTLPAASGTAIFLFGTTLTVAINRPCLLLATVLPLVTRIASGGDRTTVFLEFWVGGTASGRDGTFLQGPTAQCSLVVGNAMTLSIPWMLVYTPSAAGALPFKVFGAANDVTNYNSFAPANSVAMHQWELS